jgi:hypothetical protein
VNGRLIALWSLDPLHAGKLLDAILGLGSLAGFRAEAVDKTFEVFDLSLLVAIRGEVLLFARFLLLEAGVVVSVIANELSVPDFDDAFTDEIEKFAVVRNCKNGTWIAREVILKPTERFEIEVVRGFVEQQQIRLLYEQSRQVRTHDPATAEFAQRPVKIALAKSKARKNALRHSLRAAIGVRPGGEFHHRVRAHRCCFLREKTNPRPALSHHIPVIRFVVSEQKPEERGFASSVGPDKTDPVTGIHLQGGVLKKNSPAIGFGYLR